MRLVPQSFLILAAVPLLVPAIGGWTPVLAASASPPPVVAATTTWPGMDVPSLLTYELARFADLSTSTINVQDYGARGDGATDDTGAVQRAIDAANGGTLHFPAGTFIIDSVSVPDRARLRILGDGQGTTILKHASGSTASMILGAPQVVAQFEAENLTLDGNMNAATNRTASAIEIRADRVLIQNIEAVHTIEQAIRLRTTTFTSVVRNSWLHDFQLHGPTLNTDTRAVQIDHDLPSDGDVWMVNNRVEMTTPPSGAGNSAGGFRSSGDLNTRLFIWNNVMRNMGQDWPQEFLAPIDIYRNGDGSVIWANQVSSSYYTPIRVMRSNNVQVIDNVVDGEGQVADRFGGGINFQGRTPDVNMHGETVRGNTVRNLPHGFAVSHWFDSDGVMSGIDVSNNTISGTGGAVLFSFVRGEVTLRNNQATNVGSQYVVFQNDDTSTTHVSDSGNSWSPGGYVPPAGGPTVVPTPTRVPPTASATPTRAPATASATPTRVPATASATPTRVPATASATPTRVPATASATPTRAPATATRTRTPTAVPAASATPTAVPRATSTSASTPTPSTTGSGELAVAFAESNQQPGAWSVAAPYTLAVNWDGALGSRAVAVSYAAVKQGGTVVGPTITNSSEQSVTGGSLLLVQGSGLRISGTSAATHVSGVDGGSSASIAAPSGLRVGDLVAVYIDTPNTMIAPAGWTQRRQDGEGTVWTHTFGSVPGDLGTWATGDSHGWTHTAVGIGSSSASPSVAGTGGGGAQTDAAVSTGTASSP